MNAQTESYTRIPGRWLFFARLAWIAIALLTTLMHIVAMPVAFELLRTPCYQAPCDTPFQTPSQTESALQEEAAVNGAWQSSLWEAAVMLLTLSAGMFIFWRRSDDWMAYLTATMLVTISAAISPWPMMLADTQPLWRLPRAVLWAIGLTSGVGLFYLFPDGRFVPRWTRSIAIAFVMIIGVFAVVGAPILTGIQIFVVALATGTISQIYRYRWVSGPIQRQQTKWVLLGIIAMVLPMLIALLVGFLNPSLNPLLHPAPRSPQAEDFFGTIVIFGMVIPLCFLPVTLAFSILRYRLWDVDILINRTLVYGVLTASVVGFYVLIVGGFGTLFQIQNNLSSIFVAILLIAFLFQPLRRHLQSIADRFVPVPKAIIRESIPSPMPEIERKQKVSITDDAPNTKIRGRWLLIARLAWIFGFITLTLTYALGFLAVQEALSTVCEEEPCSLNHQVRHSGAEEQVMNWNGPPEGYADPPRPGQVKLLDTLGLTLEQYGWLGALQMGIPALVYLLIAAGLFWWKSDDWMVLFASTMIATLPFVDMPLPYTLAVQEPIWQWVHIPASIVAISTFFIFPLVFPTGQFVPRWTRWKALVDLSFAIAGTLSRYSIIRELPVRMIFAYIILSFVINAYAQSHRYFQVASPVERRQIKWVVVGVVGFISIAFVVNTYLYYHPVIIDSAQALFLSAIPDTIYRAVTLFIPVSIAIAVLRYGLWDIDILINRSLVYGALTASVVGLYVMIVGWSSIGLQTQNNLAGRILALLVIAFLFRPLRQRLQRLADRFVPVPQSTPVVEKNKPEFAIREGQDLAVDITLRGRWHLIARLVWISMFTVLTIMYALGFMEVRKALSTVCGEEPCTLRKQIQHTDAGDRIMSYLGPPVGYADRLRPEQVKALERLEMTLDQYGWLGAMQMGIPALVFLLIAAGLFWRKSDNWMALFVSIMIATIPLWEMPLPFTLAVRQPAWECVVALAFFVSQSSNQISPLIFPTGRFVPRWTRWMLLFILSNAFVLSFYRPLIEHPRVGDFVAVTIVISASIALYAQIYRYFRLASSLERQQLKWILLGQAGFLLTAILVLLPLNELLVSRAGSMDPARALILSAMIDTLYHAMTLFGPVAIVISILRYRLWDVDVLISRTLVYGTLTAGIVVTYILLIGLLGELLNTHVALAAALLTVALTIPFFQPLRLRLQRAVNRLTFDSRAGTNLKSEIEESQPKPEMPLRPRWLKFVHAAWFVCAILTTIILIGAVPVYYSRYAHPALSDPYSLGQFNVPFQILVGVGALAEIFIGFTLAVMLFWRKPNDRVALFVSFFFIITTVGNTYGFFLSAYVGAQASPLNPFDLVTFPLWILLFCIFPDGRFVPRWTRWLVLISTLAAFSYFVFPQWFFILQFTAGPQFILVTFAQLYRYRRVSSDAERQQTKWVLFGLLLTMVLSLITSLIYKKPSGPMINVIPLAVAIAILRSRLWDIDLIMNRTLVYGALTAGIVALYIILVGGLSLLSQTTGNLIVSLLATGLIAFLFQPLRERLQRGVNHLVYGERDDPYLALSRLGRRLEASLAPEAVLPTVVTTVRDVLKLPYVAIYLNHEDGNNLAAESASPSLRSENGRIRVPGMEREGLCVPLIHQGEALGYIVLGPRAPNEAFSSTDLRLLDDLAPQVGVAVHAVRLTADLQRSRERLVLAREEERRRLRRDLHDDLGPTLASLGLAASTAADLIPTDPTAAARLVKELESQMRATVGDIRRLVYDLRPPTLDELGLLPAVRERAARFSNSPKGFLVTVDAPAELPALPAAVEVAAYRIVQEALENVSKHSQAQQCAIRFTNHSGLQIEIRDNGIGLPPNITPGVGLRSMRERAEELGGSCVIERCVDGGTRILAHLPMGEFNGTFAYPDRG